MPDLVLYQYQTCPYSAKVRRRLRQLGLPFEQVEVDRDDPAMLRTLGSEMVPVLRDGETLLRESAAICGYLETTYSA